MYNELNNSSAGGAIDGAHPGVNGSVRSLSKQDVTAPTSFPSAPTLPPPSAFWPDDADYQDPERPFPPPPLAPLPLPPPTEFWLDDADYRDPEEDAQRSCENRCPHRLKKIFQIKENIWGLCHRCQRGHAAFITLTLKPASQGQPDSLEAERALRKIKSLLDSAFTEWLLVLELDKGGDRWHYHGVGATAKNIGHGWWHYPYSQIADIHRQARAEGREVTLLESQMCQAFAEMLRPNGNLRALFKHFREALQGAGPGEISRVQFTPIQNWQKVISYIVKELTTPSTEWPTFKAGTKLVHFSDSFVKTCVGDFCWNTPKTRLDRSYKSKVASGIRATPEQCKKLFGGHWNRRMEKLIGQLHAKHPRWHEQDDAAVENLIIETLERMGEGWPLNLSQSLAARQYRHSHGLPGYIEGITAPLSFGDACAPRTAPADDLVRAAPRRRAIERKGLVPATGEGGGGSATPPLPGASKEGPHAQATAARPRPHQCPAKALRSRACADDELDNVDPPPAVAGAAFPRTRNSPPRTNPKPFGSLP